jgi:hypothetical protein
LDARRTALKGSPSSIRVRTADEIDRERYALKALRGDFDRIASDGAGDARARARHALAAVRARAD